MKSFYFEGPWEFAAVHGLRIVSIKLIVYGLSSFSVLGLFQFLNAQLVCVSLTFTSSCCDVCETQNCLFSDLGMSHDLVEDVHEFCAAHLHAVSIQQGKKFAELILSH